MTHNIGDALENATSEASLAHSRKVSEKIEEGIKDDPSQFRVLTGDRPTGNLHIGHYFGSMQNRIPPSGGGGGYVAPRCRLSSDYG